MVLRGAGAYAEAADSIEVANAKVSEGLRQVFGV